MSGRRLLESIARLATPLALLTVAVVWVGAPAGARPDDRSMPTWVGASINTQQFNMCDSKCGNPLGTASNLVKFFEDLTDPWAISLNEVCLSEVASIVSVTGMHASSVITNDHATNCPFSNKNFGNTILYFGPLVAGTAHGVTYANQSHSPCSVATHECKALVCATMATLAFGNISACSTHLFNDSVSIATAQANEFYNYAVAVYYASGALWMAGDFNLRPSQVPGIYLLNFFRAPSAFTEPSSTPDQQIDYFWHDRVHSAANSPHAPYCNNAYSDHCYVFADFT